MSPRALYSMKTGAQSAFMGAIMRVLPLAHYTPLSKWMAFSLLTVEHLQMEDL